MSRAFNEPPAGYEPPRYVYVVRMRRGEEVNVSQPMTGGEVDRHIGYLHRGGWTYLDSTQHPA